MNWKQIPIQNQKVFECFNCAINYKDIVVFIISFKLSTNFKQTRCEASMRKYMWLYFDIYWCVRETMLSLINYKLRTHIWEAWTAHSVNNNTGETLHGFAPPANDSPGCNSHTCAHTCTYWRLHWQILWPKQRVPSRNSSFCLLLLPSVSLTSSSY